MDDELFDLAASCSQDPLKFVQIAFDWGVDELEGYEGPDEWQIEILEAIRDGLMTLNEAIQIAVASGHGIGKSAFVAWLILWALVTAVDTKGVVTANTENQLKTKTWAELAKWYRLCLFKSWFKYTATALFSVDEDHEKTWRVDMVPWSERNTEAFAGLHNKGKRILIVVDEASAVPDIIWEVIEGALTDEDTEILWVVLGNPTKNTGRFKECFGKFKHRWISKQVDSRTVKMTNKKQIQKWFEDYGEDHDFFRVRVRGVFPRAGTIQFIPSNDVTEAQSRDVQSLPSDPLILGVDVARFGDDQSVIYPRKGRDAKSFLVQKFRGLDTMQLAAKVVEVANELKPDAIFVAALKKKLSGGKWNNANFVWHYFYGNGVGVTLGGIGLASDFENAPSVQEKVNDFTKSILARDADTINFEDSVETDVTSQIFSIGRSTFYRNAVCDKDSCTFTFSIYDKFQKPLDINFEFYGSDIYKINHKWSFKKKR